MTDLKLIQAFDEWWEASPDRLPTKKAKDNARAAFLAGCRAALATRTYRFQAGVSVVTVEATTLKEAKAEAARILDHRASKFGVRPPDRGWPLQQVAP